MGVLNRSAYLLRNALGRLSGSNEAETGRGRVKAETHSGGHATGDVPGSSHQPVGRPEGEEAQGRSAASASPPAATHSGGEAGVAPSGQSPPFFPDTTESVVEEAEHGAAAEAESDAAADALRTSRAEERAQRRAGGQGGAAPPESNRNDPTSGAGDGPEDPIDDGDPDGAGAEPSEVREIETDPTRSGSDPLVEHFPDGGMTSPSDAASGERHGNDIEQEESRVQPAHPDRAPGADHGPDEVASEETAGIPEERLLRNDQGYQGQAES